MEKFQDIFVLLDFLFFYAKYRLGFIVVTIIFPGFNFNHITFRDGLTKFNIHNQPSSTIVCVLALTICHQSKRLEP
ncbi:hypothetical protein CJ20_203 [Escherichia phage CJ20]|nr:hypothetical protein CJ20_203 [Escherichia phage CJ20]